MFTLPIFQTFQEEYTIELSKPELKGLLIQTNDEKMFFKWLTEDEFIVSLNFSIGTNYVFDIHHHSRSAIYAFGKISELSQNRTNIQLRTRYRYGLLGIIAIPLILLLLDGTMDMNIPWGFYIVPLLFFVLASFIFRSEEQRLIKYFQRNLSAGLKHQERV